MTKNFASWNNLALEYWRLNYHFLDLTIVKSVIFSSSKVLYHSRKFIEPIDLFIDVFREGVCILIEFVNGFTNRLVPSFWISNCQNNFCLRKNFNQFSENTCLIRGVELLWGNCTVFPVLGTKDTDRWRINVHLCATCQCPRCPKPEKPCNGPKVIVW